MNKKIVLFFSFFMCLSFLFVKNINAKNITIGSRDEWINTVKEWTDMMVSDGNWRYSNAKNKTYYKDAMAAKEPVTNCALMVVHALQRFGVFGKSNKFYSTDQGQLVYANTTKDRLKAIAEIITYSGGGKKASDADLEAGDIVYYDGHVNVYIGKKNGKRTYYDAGRGTTTTGSEYGLWKSFLRTGDVNGIKGVIRLKYDQTVDVDGDVLESESENNGRTDDPYPEGFMSVPDSDDNFTCQTILIKANGAPTEFKKILDGFFGIMQFLAPVIAIVLTIIDYMKALGNGDTKKANKRTIIRIVLAVLVVFLPLLLDLLFHLFGLYDLSSCGVGR